MSGAFEVKDYSSRIAELIETELATFVENCHDGGLDYYLQWTDGDVVGEQFDDFSSMAVNRPSLTSTHVNLTLAGRLYRVTVELRESTSGELPWQ
jgi:hypothetical protein